MKTKLFACLFATVLYASVTSAQHYSALHLVYDAYNSKELQYFQNGGTLYVIMTGDKAFDDSLTSAVQHYWKVSPFKMITSADAKSVLDDKSNFYLATYSSSDYEIKFTSPNDKNGINELVIVNGKNSHHANLLAEGGLIFSDWYKVENMKLAGEIPLTVGLSYCVAALDQQMEIIIEKKIEKVLTATQVPTAYVFNEINKNAKDIKNRTLLINETWKSMLFKEKMMKDYKYSYKYVNEDELLSLMSSDPSKYCFVASEPGNAIEVFDPLTKKVLYIEPAKNGMAIVGKGDMEKLNDAMNGKPIK